MGYFSNLHAIQNDPPSHLPDDLDWNSPGEPIAARPTRKPVPIPTYTHVGWLGVRAYQSFESYWHGDGPKPSKQHAANEVKGSPGRYKALCGQVLVPAGNGHDQGAGDMLSGDGGDVTCVVPATEGRVTCRRCKAKLAKGA